MDEELQYEKSNEEVGQPEFVKEFLEANSFKVSWIIEEGQFNILILFYMKIEDKAGIDEVTLSRTFGNEK